MYTVFTNNNGAIEFFKQRPELDCTVKWVGAPAMEVLKTARGLVQQGAALASNPLVGIDVPAQKATPRLTNNPASLLMRRSVIVNPYLTVITTTQPGGTVDFKSLKKMNEAVTAYKKNAKLRFIAHNDDTIAHFQAVDLREMLQALSVLYQS